MNLAVIGAGAWGTAFSVQLASAGHKVLLWVYEPDLLESYGKQEKTPTTCRASHCRKISISRATSKLPPHSVTILS